MSTPFSGWGEGWGDRIWAFMCAAFDHIFEDAGDDGEVGGDVDDFCSCCVCDSHGCRSEMVIAASAWGLSWCGDARDGKMRRLRLNPVPLKYHSHKANITTTDLIMKQLHSSQNIERSEPFTHPSSSSQNQNPPSSPNSSIFHGTATDSSFPNWNSRSPNRYTDSQHQHQIPHQPPNPTPSTTTPQSETSRPTSPHPTCPTRDSHQARYNPCDGAARQLHLGPKCPRFWSTCCRA